MSKQRTDAAKELRRARMKTKDLKKRLKQKYKAVRESSRDYLRKFNSDSDSPLDMTQGILRERKLFEGHFNKVYSIDTSPHGELISGGVDENVIIWEMHTGIKLEMIVGKVRQVTATCFSHDGSHLAFGGMTNECCIYSRADLTTETHTFASHEGYITSCKFIDGSTLATASGDGTIKLWDAVTGREVGCYSGHGKHVTSMDHNDRLNVILSASYDGVIKIWDPRTVTDEDDKKSDDSGSASSSTSVKDAPERRATVFGHSGEVSAVRWFPSGDAFATGGDDGCVRLFDLRSRSQLNEYELPDGRPRAERDRTPPQVHSIEFLKSGCAMYVGYDVGARMVGFDTVTSEVCQEIPHEFDVHDLTVSSDGFAVVSACWDYNVRLWA